LVWTRPRHSGTSRNPEKLADLFRLDSGLRRNDGLFCPEQFWKRSKTSHVVLRFLSGYKVFRDCIRDTLRQPLPKFSATQGFVSRRATFGTELVVPNRPGNHEFFHSAKRSRRWDIPLMTAVSGEPSKRILART
jgi:hypothetical protein